MKRHHIVGIFAGICAIGLAASNLLSGNIVDGLTELHSIVYFSRLQLFF